MIFKRIKQLRIKHNLSQKEISEELNVKRSTYAGWELGTNTIPLRKLFELSNYYKFSINYIMELSKTNNYVFISNKINLKTIGSNLRYLRKKEELTQKEIAKVLKVSVSTYTLYELGNILIPTIHIYTLAKKYNCSVDEIIKKH